MIKRLTWPVVALIIGSILLMALMLSVIFVFKDVIPEQSPPVSPLRAQAVDLPKSYLDVYAAAAMQKVLTREIIIEWQDNPPAISSTVPVSWTAWVDTKLVQGEFAAYNSVTATVEAAEFPGIGEVCCAVAYYFYERPGRYDLYARLRYDTGGVEVMRMDTGEVVTQIVSGDYEKIETIDIPYLSYLPLLLRAR